MCQKDFFEENLNLNQFNLSLYSLFSLFLPPLFCAEPWSPPVKAAGHAPLPRRAPSQALP